MSKRDTERRGAQRDTVALSRDVPWQRASSRASGVQRTTVAVRPRPPRNRLSGVLVAGFVTSGWNALVVMLPILFVVLIAWWAAGSPGGLAQVLRMTGLVWLSGHAVPVELAGVPVSVPPLLLTIVVAWRLSRAGAHTMRAIAGRDAPAARAATLSVTIGYTVTSVLVAFLVSAGGFAVSPGSAAAHAALAAVLAGGAGVLAESGGGEALWFQLPVWLRRGLRAGSLSAIVMLSAGMLLVGVALAVRGEEVTAALRSYQDGSWGLLLLTLMYLPNAAIWSACYLLGPGFSVGVDTQVSVMTVDLGTAPVLPQFPLFAAVPAGPLPGVGTLLWGVPLAVGCLYGVLLAQRCVDLRFGRLVCAGSVTGVAAAAILGGLAWMSGGATGTGQLAELGPSTWQTVLVAGLVTACGATVSAVVSRGLGARYIAP